MGLVGAGTSPLPRCNQPEDPHLVHSKQPRNTRAFCLPWGFAKPRQARYDVLEPVFHTGHTLTPERYNTASVDQATEVLSNDAISIDPYETRLKRDAVSAICASRSRTLTAAETLRFVPYQGVFTVVMTSCFFLTSSATFLTSTSTFFSCL